MQRNKHARPSQNSNDFIKDETWHMSPEDALRVSYSGHK